MTINADDLRMEPWGAAAAQRANGIKVIHVPSGIKACVDIMQSQCANREIAIQMIETAITHPRYRDPFGRK